MTTSPSAVTDSAGNSYSARTGFTGGEYYPTYSSSTDIKNTADDAVYRPEMVRMSAWSAPVSSGTYDVTLKMRESWWSAVGQRVFDVTAEGRTALTDVDIFKAVGKQTAYDRTFRVGVTDGRLDLGFVDKKDAALVSAIVVTPVSTGTTPAPTTPTTGSVVARVSGGAAAVKDAAGHVFEARSGFTGGRQGTSVGGDIAGTTDDAVYAPEYVLASGWSRAVPNGTYDVTLKMREGYFSSAGSRVFSVNAEGQRKLTDVDVFKAVGKNRAYDRTFAVSVTDGRLDLGFVAAKDGATVSGIVLARSGTAPTTPTTPAPAPTTPAPTTPTPVPTTPKPTTPTTSTKRASGLIFDSGVFSMHKASEATSFENNRGAKNDVLAVFPTRDSWSSIHELWWMDSQRVPAGFTGTLNVGMPLFPKNGNLSTAAAGGYNAEWEKFARNLAAKYPTAYVRPGWEMNLPGWYYHATPANSAQWKQAFRHAVISMRRAAPGLRMVFNPNEGPGQTGTLDAAVFWPGDDVVDIVGIDAYDWDPPFTTSANIAYHRDKAYGWNHWLNFAKAHGKKFALPEWGVAPANSGSGGDNPTYIDFVYGWLQANRDHIAFETYFQESDSYIRSNLFSGSPKASSAYKAWMPRLAQK
ncbi:malectin domain-containing carbohydrate-binding protein [Agilicoccus flavus]|uniref:malectin domain-containing carbohydrate-binding protein n=1 Tax=Agilicoccus flavus TaxID=2775968 RepID=UPI001CF66F8A|nr:malectin domain-containing carbohydrate-binding protein [Agilicoccus flavus]